MDQAEQALTEALRRHAGVPASRGDVTAADDWRQLTRDVCAEVGMVLTAAQFDAAWRQAWRNAFCGGNFTLDARRILRAIEAAS